VAMQPVVISTGNRGGMPDNIFAFHKISVFLLEIVAE